MRQKVTFALILVLILISVWADQGLAQQKPAREAVSADEEIVSWYERNVKKQANMAMDEMAVFPEKGKMSSIDEAALIQRFHSQAQITEKNNFVMFLKSPEPIAKDRLSEKRSSLRNVQYVRQVSPVFYTSEKKRPETRMVLTGEIIVQFPSGYSDNQIHAIESKYGLARVTAFSFAQNTFLYQVGDPLTSLDVANRLYESGQVTRRWAGDDSH
jgi:hypothetical protein